MTWRGGRGEREGDSSLSESIHLFVVVVAKVFDSYYISEITISYKYGGNEKKKSISIILIEKVVKNELKQWD